tara:strand:+ start:270 stop:563 length:294 start_codon:yes stop_codon:yes gene_type:complete
MKSITIPILVALAIAACTIFEGEGLKIRSKTPKSIVIWANPAGDLGKVKPLIDMPRYTDQEVADIAQKHCQKLGLDAISVNVELRMGGRETTFHCQK